MLYSKSKQILQKINVPKPFDTARYLFETQFVRNIFERMKPINAQTGGGIHKVTFNGIDVILHSIKEDDVTLYNIYRKDNINKQTCLVMIITENSPIAYIDNISYYNDCVKGGLAKGGGTWLLNFAIAFLNTNKKKFAITKIQLRDNSFKFCRASKKSINLALMSTLIKGDTWYCGHGFIPYDKDNDVTDKQLMKFRFANRSIMSKIKVNQTKVEKYIRAIARKLEIEIDGIDELLEHYNNMPLSSFLKQFMENYDETCIIFGGFYLKLANNIGLFDFRGHSFYLPLI